MIVTSMATATMAPATASRGLVVQIALRARAVTIAPTTGDVLTLIARAKMVGRGLIVLFEAV